MFLKEPKKMKNFTIAVLLFRSAVCPNGIYESMKKERERERGLMKIIKAEMKLKINKFS